VTEFTAFLRSLGLFPGAVVPDAKIRRCPTESKPRKKNGAYWLSLDGRFGWGQDHRFHSEPVEWRADEDTNLPDFDPANPAAHTAANKVATNHAGTPGRAWERPEFPGWPGIPEGVEPTNYPGDRFDDYALPGAALRDDDDPTWFELRRLPRRIQLPAIDNELNRSMQDQISNYREEDVKNEAATEYLLYQFTKLSNKIY